MALGFATSLRQARADLITAAIDAGAGAGIIYLYNGVRPATGAAITTEVLVAELVFSDPSFPASSDGSITANAITSDASADTTATATWFRVVDSDLNFIFDGSIGLSNSDLNLNNINVVLGVIVSITLFKTTEGNL